MAKDPFENLRKEAERTRRLEEAAEKREQARAAKEAEKAAKQAAKAEKRAAKTAGKSRKKPAKAVEQPPGPSAEPSASEVERPAAAGAAAAAAAQRKAAEPPTAAGAAAAAQKKAAEEREQEPEPPATPSRAGGLFSRKKETPPPVVLPPYDAELPPPSAQEPVRLPPPGSGATPGGPKGRLPRAGQFLTQGFRDRSSRPRFIIWTGIGVLCLGVFMVVALGATSTYWFCANVCHKVQDDTIIAYNRSSHDQISCMACHEPVNANPLVFIMAKAESLGELYLTATNQFELPLNGDSHVAEEMPSEQCTQCHAMDNRKVTPKYGLIIDHEVHREKDVTCTQCHNRTAHREDFELTLTGPDGEENEKHEDFMLMEGCFRCHSQEAGGRAPGDCLLCHPPDFPLKPANHDAPNFYNKYGDSSGHWKLSEARPDYCPMCHTKKFCTDCHGVVMPHPEGFVKDHGEAGQKNAEACANCHAKSADTAKGLEFCNACHHKQGDPKKPWIPQHYVVVRQEGAQACFECHDPTFCARCHVRGSVR